MAEERRTFRIDYNQANRRFVVTNFLQLLIETLHFGFEPRRSRRGSNIDLRFRCTSFLVVLPQGSHPFPSRTRKLSLAGPMILRWQRRGNVGHRQGLKTKGLRAINRLRSICLCEVWHRDTLSE